MYPTKAQLQQKLQAPVPTAEKPRVKLGDCGCAPGKCC
jgi:hypothetical protein